MNLILTSFVGLMMVSITTMADSAITHLDGFTATYDLYNRGIRVAEMKRNLSQQDDGFYHFRSESHTVGLVSLFRDDQIIEESTWELENGVIKAVFYKYLHTGRKKQRNVTVDFDWKRNQIINSVNGSSWEMPFKPGTLDKLLYQYLIMLDLESNKLPLSYIIADGGKEKIYDFELLGEEVIKTPLGDLQTLKITQHKLNSDVQTTLWCAKDINYLPVKVEHIEHDGTTVAIINSLDGFGY